jgi:hypothetical protein
VPARRFPPPWFDFSLCHQVPSVSERRFPPPWSIEELNDARFIVRDSNGQQLAYVYFEEEPGRRSAAKLFSDI